MLYQLGRVGSGRKIAVVVLEVPNDEILNVQDVRGEATVGIGKYNGADRIEKGLQLLDA